MPRLVQGLLFRAVAVCRHGRRLRVRLGTLGDRHHGALGPQVDGFAPVEPLETAALDGDDVFALKMLVRMSNENDVHT